MYAAWERIIFLQREISEKYAVGKYIRIIMKYGLINEFVNRSKDILKENLVGIYLHGSSVMGCFNPEKSDIDLIIVVDDKMSDATKKAYMDMVVKLNSYAPAKGIEMSIVRKEVCDPFVYPTLFELHFSAMHLKWYEDNPEDYILKMNGTDKDLAAHFTIIGKKRKVSFRTSDRRCICRSA